MNRILSLLVLTGFLSSTGCWTSASTYYQLEYPNAQFRAGPEKVYEFSSGTAQYDYRIIDMYLKLGDGTVVRLGDLKEETARDWVSQKSEATRDMSISEPTDENGVKATRYNIDGYNRLLFRDGKLVGCHISGNLSTGPMAHTRISPTADGEFLSFPILREDLIRVFGQPTEIKKVTHKPPN